MRVAFVVAPAVNLRRGDSQPPSMSTRALRDALGRNRFRVIDVPPSAELAAEFARAVGDVGPGDEALVYVAGATRLQGDRTELRLPGDGAWPSFGPRGEALFARDPASALFFVDARHDGDPDDAMLAAEHADGVVRALEA